FRPVIVPPTSPAETLAILRSMRGLYEEHHRVQLPDEALQAAVELSDLHLAQRCLPGKAVQLLDEAAALVRLRHAPPPFDLRQLDAQLDELVQAKEAAVANQEFDKAANLREQADRLKKEREARAREAEQRAVEMRGVVDVEAVAAAVHRMA